MNEGVKPITLRVGAAPRDMPTAGELEAFSGDPHFMLSLARGLLVLQAFVGHGPKLTVSDAAPTRKVMGFTPSFIYPPLRSRRHLCGPCGHRPVPAAKRP